MKDSIRQYVYIVVYAFISMVMFFALDFIGRELTYLTVYIYFTTTMVVNLVFIFLECSKDE